MLSDSPSFGEYDVDNPAVGINEMHHAIAKATIVDNDILL